MNVKKTPLPELCHNLSRQFPQKFSFNGEILEWLSPNDTEAATMLVISGERADGPLFQRRVENLLEDQGWLVSVTGKVNTTGDRFYITAVSPAKDDADPLRWGIGSTREAASLRLLFRHLCGD